MYKGYRSVFSSQYQNLCPDRARKCLHMSQNCLEKLGIQGFFAAFLRLNYMYYLVANFWQVFKDETVVFKRYFVPITGCSVAKVVSLSVYFHLSQSIKPHRFSIFPKFCHFTVVLLWCPCMSHVFQLCLVSLD